MAVTNRKLTQGLGILIMYLISYGCSVSIHRPAAFRIAWGLQAVPGAILFVSLFFFPESPRWLASKDRWEECHEILANLHARGDRSNIEVLTELEEVREAARIAAESKEVGYLGLFAPRMWKRTLVGVSAQIWQQLLGGNIMLYYLVYIFNMAGMVSFPHDTIPFDSFINQRGSQGMPLSRRLSSNTSFFS